LPQKIRFGIIIAMRTVGFPTILRANEDWRSFALMVRRLWNESNKR
jgi:hypothetical protein